MDAAHTHPHYVIKQTHTHTITQVTTNVLSHGVRNGSANLIDLTDLDVNIFIYI